MGYYSWLHDLLFHILSAPQSCWPDVAKNAMSKRGKKYGGIKYINKLETMALAGIFAKNFDNLSWHERNFLKIADEFEAEMISLPELYIKLEQNCGGKWNNQKYHKIKKKLQIKINKKENKYEK